MKRLVALVGALCICAFCVSEAAQDSLVVFAGTASQPPLEEAVSLFEKQTGKEVILHLGGSGAMLSQIRLSGQGDVYIPGSSDYLEKARELGLVEVATPLAYLVPAILVPKNNPQGIRNLRDLTRPGLRVGLADPDGVCVGLYAVEILETNEIAEQARPNLNGFVESCAKTAAMLPLGMVDVVLGWREFASWNPDVIEAVLLKPEEIPRLAYIPAAQLKNASNKRVAEQFIDFLVSDQAVAIFHKWGYFTDEESIRFLAPKAQIGGTYKLPGGW
jgi:molybdate transport system substrate-binding protein